MANQMNKEQWIKEVFESSLGMVKAQPRDGLFERVIHQLGNKEDKYIFLPFKQWAVAAMLLLAVNIATVMYHTVQTKRMGTVTTDPLASEMQIESTYNY